MSENSSVNKIYDAIIVGGSYSGLSAAMALGRALKNVLIIDNVDPCNKLTPFSHNFLTNDGVKPEELQFKAKTQVSQYTTVSFVTGKAITGKITGSEFAIQVENGEIFNGKFLIFATGIKDILPPISGISECWGISVLHCPFCHGYEVRNEKTGILVNGNADTDFIRLISNWTKNLVVFTNGTDSLNENQKKELKDHNITISEKVIKHLEHQNGILQKMHFTDDTSLEISVLYAPSPFEQKCKIPESLGCELTDEGYIKIDNMNETSLSGIYATGDNSSRMRTVANAVSMGTTTGIIISKKLILH